MDLMSSQRQEQPEGDESDLARLPLFPIEDHLVQLLRAGRIKSLGKRPSERRHQELSAADWMGLEISELVGLSVAKAEATCLFVRLSQPDVLREFPALPIELKLPSTERPDLMTVLHNEIEAKGATLETSGGRENCAEGRRHRGSKKNSRSPQSFGRVKHNKDHEKIALTRSRNFALALFETASALAFKAHLQPDRLRLRRRE